MNKFFQYAIVSIFILTQTSCQVKLAPHLVPSASPSPVTQVSNNNQNDTLGQIEFRRILSGEKSNIRDYETRIIDNEVDFVKLWDDHTGTKTNPIFIPKIDFGYKNVIAVFLGERPTTGFSLDVAIINETKDSINVSLRENKPQPGSEVKAEITQPFLIIETKKSTKKVNIERPLLSNAVNQQVEFKSLEIGYDSGIKEFSKRLAKTDKEFSSLYIEHLTSQKNVNATVFPKVDFKNEMVAGIFLGERPSSGYTLDIKRVVKTDSQIIIEASETPPTKDSNITSIITAPYQFITLPQSDLPVKFDINLIVPKYDQINSNPVSNTPKDLKIKTFLSGESSSIKDSNFVLIQNREQFKTLWTQHMGSTSSVVPDIDFVNNSLIAVFAGSRPTSGFNINVSSVVEIGNDVRIFIDLSKDNTQVKNISTNPFSMVLIPKTNKSPLFILNNIGTF